MPRWKPAKPQPHTNEENSKRFMKVFAVVGDSIDGKWYNVPLQYDWTPTRQQCGQLLSVYLECSLHDVFVKEDPVIVWNQTPLEE